MVMPPFQPSHSQIETSSLLSVQFPNFLEGLFCIFCNSSVYSPQDGETKPIMQCSTCECPKASRTMHSTFYLVLTTLTMVTLVAFMAAAANRKDLRISTNSSLKSLSSLCTCQLQILFHAITVWLFPATQTFSHTYSYSEASRNHQHQYHYLKTTEHHSKTWKLLCAFLTPQHKGNAG